MARKKKAENNGFNAPVDPNREKQINQYSVLPGGPGTMDPANVGSQMNNGNPGPNLTPYGQPGMTNANAPVMIAPPGSGPMGQLPQSNPPGIKNNSMPYNMQPQPPGDMQPFMLGQELGMAAQQKGLIPSMMGPTGVPTPMPGAMAPQMPQQGMAMMPGPTIPPEQMAAGGMNTKTGKRSKKA